MTPRRPVSRPARGVVASAAVLAALSLLAGCSGDDAPSAPGVAAASLDEAGEQTCTDLLTALPDRLGTVEQESVDERTAAYAGGVVLTCGVDEPATLEPTSECDQVLGVGWFIDPDELADPDSGVVATAVGYRPRVAVAFPSESRGQVSLEVLSALAAPVRDRLELVQRCR